jgi:hypothetical protein
MRRPTNYNSLIVETYKIEPILFNRVLGEITGSATAGLFLSQLLFWWDKGATNGWIYKTIKDVQLETCLKRSEQDRAIRAWKALGVLKVKLRSIPRKRFFQIDVHVLGTLIVEHIHRSSLQKSTRKLAESDATDGRNQHANSESTKEKHQRVDFSSLKERKVEFLNRSRFPGSQ